MRLLPYENFYLLSQIKPADLQARLEKEVEPVVGFSFKRLFSRSSSFYFSGYTVNGIFQIKRVIFYRNSFLPRIYGEIEPYLNGSQIHIKMRMHVLVIVFMSIWLGGVLFGAIAFLIGNIIYGFNITSLIPVVMFLFGYGIMMGGFKYESRKAKAKLLIIFNAETCQPE